MNSRQKGKRGELELSEFLREHGYTARRGQQYSGTETSADIVTSLPFHVECKRVEAGNPYDWLAQAIRDSAGKKVPVVFHKRNRRDWIVVLRAEDFMRMNHVGQAEQRRPDCHPENGEGVEVAPGGSDGAGDQCTLTSGAD